MKGQFFIISGLVVVVVLLLIKSSLNLSQLIENKRFLESSLEKKEFSNIRDELVNTVELSYNKNETENVENYIVYVRNRLESRAIDLKGIAVEASFKNVTDGSDTGLNVTAFNFLGETISSLKLTFSYDGSSQTFSNVADNTSRKKDFTFNTPSDVNYTLSINYITTAESKQYAIQIPIEIGKSKFIGFFDLRMTGLGENRDEFSKVVETA
jgi:hypothetical protein